MTQIIMERTELFRQFSCVDNYPLTLVTAATGFGKSTTVRNYLTSTNKKIIGYLYVMKKVVRNIYGILY